MTGAVLYRGGSEDPERVAIWIPGTLRPGGHEADIASWIDDDDAP